MTELAIRFTNEDENSNVHQLYKPTDQGLAPDPEPEVSLPAPSAPLPQFEKAAVSQTEIKISGAVTIETHGEMTVQLDDLIRAVGVFRVTQVSHYVNKHGDVIRRQVLMPVNELEVVPFDPDSGDEGIIRARPE